jgi:hypothetical protein
LSGDYLFREKEEEPDGEKDEELEGEKLDRKFCPAATPMATTTTTTMIFMTFGLPARETFTLAVSEAE